jgi:hypothetical protein
MNLLPLLCLRARKNLEAFIVPLLAAGEKKTLAKAGSGLA